MRHPFGRAVVAGIVAAIATTGVAVAAVPAAHAADAAVVRTDRGMVRGAAGADHRTFQGIPYAAPPVGELRWASPRLAQAWHGVRDATRPGSDCAQTAGFLGDPSSDAEDCLYLNVTTPRRQAARPRPVLVFIHGGGFFSGSGRLYGAERLAANGDLVVVTPNYRLGVFGFLAHPALGERSGDFGLEDQQAALRWVRRNAAAFGGDPGNVTIVGESAGSVSICGHLAAPSSAGLFQRAIMQSGPCTVTTEWPYARDGGNWYPRPRAVADREGEALAGRLGCALPAPASVATCLRGQPVAALLEASAGGQGYGPVYGGGVLPIGPAEAMATGRFARVPVIHGTTRDEHRTFVAAIEQFTGHVVTAEDYQAEVQSVLGADAPRVLARYPLADFPSPSVALATVWTDAAWACPALATDRALARHVPTYGYEFADQDAPWAVDGAPPSFPTGAFHAAELQYLFTDEQFPGPVTPAQWRLADQMIAYWSRFAHTGNPNGPGLPHWALFDDRTGLVRSLAPGRIGTADLGRDHRCGFWQSTGSL
ncbi:carboxylesterase/lipase family protein [Phytohabitans aurantiacus]|uniref:carboxylesterase/lipase family protein n=1 Tax=Phytohabitans aurantiacus TaxID=3016789 RepID=UPI002492D171|nr:carboxylesterase family protein [Phytohabitans aurantiacus]